MSNNSWGDLIFKLVAIPFSLLLLLMVIHQAVALQDKMNESDQGATATEVELGEEDGSLAYMVAKANKQGEGEN